MDNSLSALTADHLTDGHANLLQILNLPEQIFELSNIDWVFDNRRSISKKNIAWISPLMIACSDQLPVQRIPPHVNSTLSLPNYAHCKSAILDPQYKSWTLVQIASPHTPCTMCTSI